jgi:hypothetical protein
MCHDIHIQIGTPRGWRDGIYAMGLLPIIADDLQVSI